MYSETLSSSGVRRMSGSVVGNSPLHARLVQIHPPT